MLLANTYGYFLWLAKVMFLSFFLLFQKYVKRYFNHKIKIVHSDWDGEYRSLTKFFNSLAFVIVFHPPILTNKGWQWMQTLPHCRNGSWLTFQANVPLRVWDKAFQTACYLINRLPTPLLKNSTPYEKLFHTTLGYSLLRVFGCACWPNLWPYNSHKLQPRSLQCVFLGYSLIHEGCKCFHISSECTYISRDVVFGVSSFPFKPKPKTDSTPSQSCLPVLSIQPMVSLSGPHAKTILKPSALFLFLIFFSFFFKELQKFQQFRI